MLETLPRRTERRPPGRPKGGRAAKILVLLIFLVGGGALAAGGYYSWATGGSGPRDPVDVTIPEGATGAAVADLLENEGVIRSAFGFRLKARLDGRSLGFEAGRYRLTTNMAAGEAMAALEDGPFVETVQATFAEGLTVQQTAARAAEQLGINSTGFINAARNGTYVLPPYLPEGTETVEGFLFPNTYDFYTDVRPDDVIRRLLQEFDRQAADLPWQRAAAHGLSEYEIVVVASMIEEETRLDEERPMVARVIYNRLARDMTLGIDATIRYALQKYTDPLTQSDLEVDSPYNTRIYHGLPPTPIASPGRASLEAALNPADGDWLYYVLRDTEGHHGFTADYDEFLRWKAEQPDQG